MDRAWINAHDARKRGTVYRVHADSEDPRLAQFRELEISEASYNRLLA